MLKGNNEFDAARFDGSELTAHVEASLDLMRAGPEFQKAWTRPEQIADARALADMGFAPGVIRDVTAWPDNFVRRMFHGAGTKARGGKLRSDLSDLVRVPRYHAAMGEFVMALEHQLAFWGDRWLTARCLVRAMQYVQTLSPEVIEHIPVTGFYSVAKSVVDGSSKSATCKQCRGHYAHFSLASGLTSNMVFDCPICRLISLMLPTARRADKVSLPTSFADLNLRTPLTRFVSRGADTHEVRGVISLAYGAVARNSP